MPRLKGFLVGLLLILGVIVMAFGVHYGRGWLIVLGTVLLGSYSDLVYRRG